MDKSTMHVFIRTTVYNLHWTDVVTQPQSINFRHDDDDDDDMTGHLVKLASAWMVFATRVRLR